MTAQFKITSYIEGIAKAIVSQGEVDVTGDGIDPTLPQMVVSLIRNVADEQPIIHKASRIEIEVQL